MPLFEYRYSLSWQSFEEFVQGSIHKLKASRVCFESSLTLSIKYTHGIHSVGLQFDLAILQ